jgi:hypothetical protein
MGITRSELERRFLGLVTNARLPRPELNAPLHVGGRWIEVDCLWRAQRVAAELDGRRLDREAPEVEADLRTLLLTS